MKQLSSAWHISAAILTIISNKTFCHTIHSPELPMKPTDHSFSAERHWPRTIFCINSFSPSPPWPPQSSSQCVPLWEVPTPLGPALPRHFIFKHLNSSQNSEILPPSVGVPNYAPMFGPQFTGQRLLPGSLTGPRHVVHLLTSHSGVWNVPSVLPILTNAHPSTPNLSLASSGEPSRLCQPSITLLGHTARRR